MKNGRLEGYMTFAFQPDPRQKYQIHVTSLLYNNREVLSEMLSFLHSQSDQVEKIILDTHDEYFHFLADNPATGEQSIFLHHQTSVEGLGIMYRVINCRSLFENLKDHDFGGVTLTLRLTVKDSYYPKNNDSFVIGFENGRPRIKDNEDCSLGITMDTSEFSSLIMGVVPFSRLYEYSKAEISDPRYLPEIDRLFFTPQKPECYTRF